MVGQREIDGMRNLRRQTVVSERRDQANYCPRNSNRERNEIRTGERRSRGQPVKSTTALLDLARIPGSVKRPWVNAEPDHVRREQHAPVFDEHLACFRESCVGGWHWIDSTDSISRIRGLYPLVSSPNVYLRPAV
jgi:hypothetical protein